MCCWSPPQIQIKYRDLWNVFHGEKVAYFPQEILKSDVAATSKVRNSSTRLMKVKTSSSGADNTRPKQDRTFSFCFKNIKRSDIMYQTLTELLHFLRWEFRQRRRTLTASYNGWEELTTPVPRDATRCSELIRQMFLHNRYYIRTGRFLWHLT